MGNENALFKRNKLAVNLLWVSIIFGLTADIINKASFEEIFYLLGFGIVAGGISTYLTYKRIQEDKVKYIILAGVILLSYFLISSSQKLGDYLLLYYALAFVTIYHDSKLIIMVTILNLVLTNYFFFIYKDSMYKGYGSDYLFDLNLYLILISAILAFQSKIGSNMRKDIEANNEKAIEDKKNIEEILEKTSESINTLTNFSSRLMENLNGMKEVSNEIASAFSEISKSVESQAQSASGINSSVIENNEEMQLVSQASSYMKDLSSYTEKEANKGNEDVFKLNEEYEKVDRSIIETVTLVNELNEKTELIEEILGTINQIAAQTDLLALNASIEAARAGEHGKGFVIVADEIRKLADASTVSTEGISNVLTEIINRVEMAANKVYEVRDSFESSKTVTKSVEDVFANVNKNSVSLSLNANDVDSKITTLKENTNKIIYEVSSISSITEENSASIEEVTASVLEQNDRIDNILESFKEIDDLVKELKDLSEVES